MNKTIIIDNHLLFLEEIKLMIENEGFIVRVDEVKDGKDYLDISKIHRPDFIVLNSGVKVLNWLKENVISIVDLSNLDIFELTYPYENNDISINNRILNEKKKFESSLRKILRGKKIYSEQII